MTPEPGLKVRMGGSTPTDKGIVPPSLSKKSQAALVKETRDNHSTASAGQVRGDETDPWSNQEDKSLGQVK